MFLDIQIRFFSKTTDFLKVSMHDFKAVDFL